VAHPQSARLLKVDDRLGTIEAGRIAQVLIVDGNPLDDLSVISQTHTVIKGGE
jgi:imidazolonepropionase-like amidohydrolase